MSLQNPGPQYPDFPKVMSEGCGGFARGVLQWPSDMILGAAKRNATTGALSAASALQSVFLVASPNDVYLRFKTSVSKRGFMVVVKPDIDCCISGQNQLSNSAG